jgi:hypothetical protein
MIEKYVIKSVVNCGKRCMRVKAEGCELEYQKAWLRAEV